MSMTNYTTPVGRIVWGSLYKAKNTDAEGKPLVYKTGANAGQPRVEYAFGLAIPKNGEAHWEQTAWGALIKNTGVAAFPQGQHAFPTFAWKVIDGDSQVPNRKMVKPCTREGYPNHWVLSISSAYAPRCYNADGSQELTTPDAIKCGYYVQVN
jgi:hypothetical protein